MKVFYHTRVFRYSVLLLTLLSWLPLVAQKTISVSGIVLDPTSEPLIGVSVMVVGSTQGTTTDLDGKFSLARVADNASLEISYIGMKTQRIALQGRTQLTITLQEDNQSLDELVVVGYGVQRKVNLSGAVSSVDTKKLEARPVTNLTNGLQGIVPGLVVSGTNGAPGLDGGNIRIRGTGTFNNANPYILVDGVETGTLNALDPNDIESVSVLKDASSAAIYGSKASNGVILITTKRGKAGKTNISYSGYVGMQNATHLIERMDAVEYAELYNKVLTESGRALAFDNATLERIKNGTDPRYGNTDWYALAFKTGVQHRHNVNITGGAENVKYMTSAGYLKQSGILPNAQREQFNARTNLDLVLSKKITAKVNLAFIKNDYSDPSSAYAGGGSDQIIRQLNIISPWLKNKYDNGEYGTVSDGNPIAWLDSGMKVDRKNKNFAGSLSLTYEPIKDLKLTATTAYTANNQDYKYFRHFIQYNANKATEPNYLEERFYRWDRLNVDLLANYLKSFGNHNLAILAGWSLEDYHYAENKATRSQFPNNKISDMDAGTKSTQQNEGFSRELGMISYFGRLNYDYDGKYLLEANLRADASSRFLRGHRWGYFPSFSAAWRISRENFMDWSDSWLSDLKLRASWGMLGNQEAFSTDFYPAISNYSTGYNYPLNGVLQSGYALAGHKLPNITWERTTTQGIGIDFALLQNRLTGSFDLYTRKTTHMIMDTAAPREFALGDYKDNIGSLENRGWELALGYNDHWGEVSFGAYANLSYNRSEITDLGGATWVELNTYRQTLGHGLDTYYLQKADGLIRTQEELDSYAAAYGSDYKKLTGYAPRLGEIKYIDANGDGKLDSNDRVYEGSRIPKYTFGFGVNAGYKGFDLAIAFNGVSGAKMLYSKEVWGGFYGQTGHPSTAWRDAWSETNTGGTLPRIYLEDRSPSSPGKISSTFWLQDISYLRLKNLQLGYTLPKTFTQSFGVKGVRIYYSAENLLTLHKLPINVDPEATSTRLSSYPLLRTHSFGINVTF